MSGVDAFVSDDIDDNFGELDDAAYDDYQKDRIHVESFSYKTF